MPRKFITRVLVVLALLPVAASVAAQTGTPMPATADSGGISLEPTRSLLKMPGPVRTGVLG